MNKKKKPSFDSLFRQGTELLQRQKFDQAIDLLKKAHAMKPTHVDAAVNLSGAYILTKKFKQAVRVLEPLSQAEGAGNAMLWTNLGAAYLGNPILARDEEQKRAIAAFEQALAINPIASNVAYNIGLIYRDRQENEQAIHWFKKAIQANPNDRDARNIIERLAGDK
ncbi:MAG: tetratricopeptide repeat protein [Anaerolineae bacterium]